jgi:hypothetical protein
VSLAARGHFPAAGAAPAVGALLGALLVVCIARFWIAPLPSSFWVDEMVTVFVNHQGASHASLAVAPQVTATIYYALPRAAERLFGFSETAYRVPSLLAMGFSLWFIARLAARLIHPFAGWLAVFACFSLRGFNYEAADARPYALGTCVAAASLWFLVRWLDSARWRDAVAFALLASLLWRVHLLFWPFYLVYVLYAAARLARSETSVSWPRAAAVFGSIGLALLPVAVSALALLREAKAHVIVPDPSWRDLRSALKLGLVAGSAAAALLLSLWLGRTQQEERRSPSSLLLVTSWWLVQPLCLYTFSRVTGESVFVPRYLSLTLPGAALSAAFAASLFLPRRSWHAATALFALGVLVFVGDWRTLRPLHHNSDWRAAIHSIEQAGVAPQMPVLCPSPFIEARAPDWRPDYPLPGFLYAHLSVYPLAGHPYLLPFQPSSDAEDYAARLTSETLRSAGRFAILGSDRSVRFWRHWLAARPELAGWKSRRLGPFGDVEVVFFEDAAPTRVSPATVLRAQWTGQPEAPSPVPVPPYCCVLLP